MNYNNETQKNLPLHIDKELEEYITPLKTSELEALRLSIMAVGLREPIMAWQDIETDLPTLVDGHNRYKICHELGIDYKVVMLEFASKDEVKGFMLDTQEGRRNLDTDSIARAYMIGREYRQSVGKRGENLQQGKAHSTGKTQILTARYDVSLPTAKRCGELYEAIQKVKSYHDTFDILQVCIDEGKTIAQADIKLLGTVATIVELMDLQDAHSLHDLIKKLKKRAKEVKNPIAQSEPTENGGLEGTAEGEQKESKEPESLKELRKQLQVSKDQCTNLERTTEKQGKTIEQQNNQLAKYEQPKELNNDLYIVHTIFKSYAENMNKLQRAIQEYLAQFEFITLSDIKNFFAQIKVEVKRLNEVHSRCTAFSISSNLDIDAKYQKIMIGESISLTLVKIAGYIQKTTPKTDNNAQEYDIAQREFEINDLLAQNEELRNLKVGDIPPYRLLQLRKIAENYTVFRLEKNKISELVVSGYESDWKVQEFSTGAEAMREFAKYEVKNEYFCIK